MIIFIQGNPFENICMQQRITEVERHDGIRYRTYRDYNDVTAFQITYNSTVC